MSASALKRQGHGTNPSFTPYIWSSSVQAAHQSPSPASAFLPADVFACKLLDDNVPGVADVIKVNSALIGEVIEHIGCFLGRLAALLEAEDKINPFVQPTMRTYPS